MKATINTVARESGLSPATVDRVLHGRAGVSAVARQKVLTAARKLGYLPDADSIPLPARPANLEFLLPVGTNAFLAELATHLEDFAARLPLVASCRIHRLDGPDSRHLLEAAGNVSPATSGVGIVATDDPRTRELIRDLSDAGTRVVTIASDIPTAARAAYVGVDNRAAGRVAGLLMGRLIPQRAGELAVFLGSHKYRGHEERDAGFRSILTTEFPQLKIARTLEVQDARTASYDLAVRLLRDHPGIVGIYCVGGGRSGVVKALRELGHTETVTMICHDLTAEARKFLIDGSVDVVIDQNARLIAEQSVIALLGSIASALPSLTRKYVEPRIIFRENIPLV